ncbi:hypothetical protein BDL97_05G111600 [Sphagnum fallax]|nr:hypothetical protein BDL97_05G111600 [Sphagnum fallax]
MWVSCCVVLWCLVWSVCCDSGVACLAWPARWNLELGFCNCGTQEDDRERKRERERESWLLLVLQQMGTPVLLQ